MATSKISFDEIMNDYLEMNICTRWVLKIFTSLQRANQVDCCDELMENCNQEPTRSFHRIATREETWIRYYNPLSQQEAKNLKETRRKHTNPTTSHTIGSQHHHDHLLGL